MEGRMNPYKPRVKAPDPAIVDKTSRTLFDAGVDSVCESSACPNKAECYERGTATFMILGRVCTRACRFCNVETGRGSPPDPSEPQRLARAVESLGLRYIVITSVDRDDLKDFGASHFMASVQELRRRIPELEIELLTPDFGADCRILEEITSCGAYKLAHNIETVERLSPVVRPQRGYERSLEVLGFYSKHFSGAVKSSLMVGLGESEAELERTMADLLEAGVRELTVGQYLQPSPRHLPVERYYPEGFFEDLEKKGYEMGFSAVKAGVLVRSSYYADSY